MFSFIRTYFHKFFRSPSGQTRFSLPRLRLCLAKKSPVNLFFSRRDLFTGRFFSSSSAAVFLLFLILFFCNLFTENLSLSAQKKKKPLLRPVYIDLSRSSRAVQEQKPEEVWIDRSNITILARAGSEGKKINRKRVSKTVLHKQARWTPYKPDSLAKFLAEDVKTKQIYWKPFTGSNYPSGTAVFDAKLSPDKSVIAFLERLGRNSGPYATRIVLYDTHQWQILQAVDLAEAYALQCTWIRKKHLALLCMGQKSRKTKNALLIYDPEEKKIIQKQTLDFIPGKSFLSNEGDYLLITEKDTGTVHLFRYDANEEKFLKNKTFQIFDSEPLLAKDDSGRHFFFCDRKNIYFCRLSDRRINEKLPLPKLDDFFKIHAFVPLKNQDFLLFPSYASGTQARFLSKGNLIPIGNPSSGVFLPGLTSSTFVAGFSKGGEFGIYQYPNLDRVALFSVNTTKPRTRGTPIYSFTIPHAKAFAILDSQGLFYLIYPDRANKKYLKEILSRTIE